MWCNNILEVSGSSMNLEIFRKDMRTIKGTDSEGKLIEIPLQFSNLLPRPPELDVEESSLAHLVYEALYGDWEKLLKVQWIQAGGAKDRSTLIRFLEQVHEDRVYLAKRYRANECKYGFRNWRDWNIEHYGTKWDLDDTTQVEEADGKLIYRFRTFETPPKAWFELLKSTYPNLKMTLKHRSPFQVAAQADIPLNRFY